MKMLPHGFLEARVTFIRDPWVISKVPLLMLLKVSNPRLRNNMIVL